jgi:lipopolysaccharide export system permease protein
LKRFDAYILYRLVSIFCFFSLILTFIYWSNRSVRTLDLLLGDGKSISVFINLTLLSLPNIILAILPVSGLISAIYLTNRLNADSELIILRSAGTSNLELSKPFLKLGLIVSLLVGVLSHQIVPTIKNSAKSMQNSVSNEINAMFLRSGEFFNPTQNLTIYIGKIKSNKELSNFFLEDNRDPKKLKTFISKTAYLSGNKDNPQIVLKDGSAQTYLTEEKSLDILYFKDFLYDFKVLYDKKVIKQKDTVKETRTTQLIESLISTDSLTRLDTESIKTEIHRRISETLLPTVIILLGFSCLIVTKFTRQQTWLPTAIAISLIVLLQLLANYFEDLNRSNIIGIWGYYVAPIFGGLLLTLLSLEINLKKNDNGNAV